MRYKYDVKQEVFVREDGLGKKFYINSSEAHRIMTMYSLGNSIGEIRNKIQFVNARRVTESTIINFIRNVEEGNIELNEDYPAPTKLVTELTDSERLYNLEERVSKLEDALFEEIDFKGKVKSWLKL